VKYVLVGDLAAFLYGSKITTSHVEVAICPSHENVERLAAALQEIDARPWKWSAESYRLSRADLSAHRLNMQSSAGDVDLLARDNLDELSVDSAVFEISEVLVRVASTKILIEMMRATGDEFDDRHAAELQKILEDSGQ
jgi:hypothetical protein